MKTSNEFESTTLTLLSLLFFHICMASENHQPPLTDRSRVISIEKTALLEFKSSVSSDPNSVLSNWNMFTKACDFNGVECDQWRIHVVRINLNRTLIVGTIAPVLANLTALRQLDLSENFLTGHIPPELSKLRRLKILDLSNNQLDGMIPESLSHLNGLDYFNIHGNLLIGSIPASIFINWTKLIVLDLSNNSLSGEIPMNVGITLPWLFALNLYLNNLRGKIPSWLSNSSEISQLDVENNEFSGELPSEMIGKWNHIEVLHLSYTHFSSHNNNTDLDPFFNALSNCSILKELEMAGIDLCGHLPRGVGLNISSLLVLNLDSNKIYGIIPPNIAKLRNLTLLNLSNNLIGGVIPEEISHLRHLQRFILSNNILGGAIPKMIGNMSSVGLLDLSNNRFTGEIPESIGNLAEISELYLHKNQLLGQIPSSLGKCLSLNRLDLSYNNLSGIIPTTIAGILKIFLNLSNNQLHGPLPLELGKMDQVEEIDISSNKISGPLIPQLSHCVAVKLIDLSNNLLQGSIPKSIGDLHDLELLDLSCNFLSGEIPQSLNNCTSLKLLNLSYNDFSGLIPSTGIFNLFTDSSFLGNPHLYRNLGRKKGKWIHSKTFLIIVCVFSTVMASTITILFVIIIKRIRKKILNRREKDFGGVTPPALRLSYPRITYSELSEATRGFTEETLIGTGSYGSVYRGILKDETVVAVKVLRLQSGNSTKSFKRECEVLKRIRHRNLMRIITACSRPEFKAIVLPFMSNGSLDAKLHSNNHHMDLEQRISILSDVAEGMAYLHHHSPVKVIHCDLKPSNVLLNEDMAALVSDFGISRLVMNMGAGVTTAGPDNASSSTANILYGSIGYIAPEYGFGSNATTKGDVYSFGVLVLELLTRKRPMDEMFGGEISLQKWVKNHYHEQSLETVIDSSLMRTARSKAAEMRRMWEVAISEVVEIGLLCTQENPLMRPTMLDAADDFDRLKRYLSGDTTATFASSMGMSSSTVGENII
ncbi:putative leucine-rich repeat receptor-like serine/threonine-protein kinase At2g24130 [Phalaenopsis equestris]|uniref:putative leucine-rich repeat receptor-like serine/threonine-protein kinase At2g24130 n=1 Tax=Phalaenopsis equestris TaxID=78828 RepID=UPI0009E5FB5B|nr:putative leucine-rich repeat receptor-like serine/threonine-protein kinase At2g24130 [Phalaenopsis equestris]